MSTDTVHVIKVGDTLPAIEATLIGAGGVAQDLTGATVTIGFRKAGTTALLWSGVATIVTPLTGEVLFPFPAGVTATLGAGLFEGEFSVALAGGGQATFPSDGYIQLRILPEIVP